MRLSFITILCATIIQLTNEILTAEKTEVKVGALFFAEEDDIELSFDEAFREVNGLKFFELNFVTIKRYLSTDDSLLMQTITCELIASGVAAIFGPSSKASSDIVALIANTTGIPHIKFDWMLEKPIQMLLNHKMSVNVAPAITSLSRAYFDIIKTNYEWKVFSIFYETDEGLARVQDLLDIQPLDRDFIKLRRITDYEDDYRVLFKEAAETFHEHRIVVDCSPELLEELINVAIPFNLLGPFKHWFFTHLDTQSSKLKYIYNESFKANITAVRLKAVERNPYERRKTRISKIDEILGNQTMLPVFIYDAVVLFANAARNIITSLQQYEAPYQRCSVGRNTEYPWYMGIKIVEEMKTISEDDVEPAYKTECMKIDENGMRTQFHLEIYKPTVNEPLALWKPDGSISPIQQRLEYQSAATTQDFSMSRKIFTVVTHFEEPYFMYKQDAENFRGVEKYEGYAVDLIQKLSELMDFEYDFIIVPGNGKYNAETKTWDGVIGKLIEHHAQIGICDITITQLRRQFVDFTVPFMQLGIAILYYKEPPEPKDPFAFLKPFESEVWIYMMLTQLVMTLAFVFIARISHTEWISPHPGEEDPDEVENIWNTSNAFWLMGGSIMQQGCDILPRGGPMRILTGVWWFFAMIIISTYTANLAAVITSNKIKSSINSLEDLIDQDKVKFGTVRGGATSMFFSESNDTDYSKAWNQMISFQPSAFTTNNKEGVERVRKGKGSYAFLMESTGMSYNIERNCDLKQIGHHIGEKHYGIAVPLGAEYRTNLSVSILQLSEKGELYRMKEKWWKRHNVTCSTPHEVDGDELSIIELGGVFVVLGGGVVVAIIIGIFEFIWNVERVAVREKCTPWEALKAELLFVLKFWIKRKPMIISESAKSSRRSSRRSSMQSQSRSRKSQSRVQSAKSSTRGS